MSSYPSDTDKRILKTLLAWSKNSENIKKVALVLNVSCGGDSRKLLCSYRREDGLYGRAAVTLFDQNTEAHRNALFRIWNDNKGNVKEEYIGLSKMFGEKTPKLKGRARMSVENHHKRCICDGAQVDDLFIQCDFCNGWLHQVCAGLTKEQAVAVDKFKCKRCSSAKSLPKKLPDETVRTPTRKFSFSKITSTARRLMPFSQKAQQEESHEITPSKSITPEKSPALSTSSENSDTKSHYKPSLINKKGKTNSPLLSEKSASMSESVASSSENLSDGVPLASITSQKVTDATDATSSVRLDSEKVLPVNFETHVSREEYLAFITKLDRMDEKTGARFKVESNYTRVLVQAFNQRNKCCLPCFTKKVLRMPDKPNQAFFRAYSYCKRPPCTAKYTFLITQSPFESRDKQFKLQIRKSDGVVKHDEGQRAFKPLAGKERQEIKKNLVTKKPSNVLRELFGRADMQQLAFGNFNMVKNLRVIQQARYEVLKEENYHEDMIIDVVATYFKQKLEWKHKKLPGFLQRLSLVPFFAVMYTHKQIDYLGELLNRGNVTLFLDSTGSLCKQLPEPFDQTKIFYYAMVAKSPSAGDPPVPILEFYSARHDTCTIAHCLRVFLDDCSKYWRNETIQKNVKRIEIDFSKALMAGVAGAFQNHNSLGYLEDLWESLVEGTKPKCQTAIHICRFHVLKMFKAKLRELFPRGRGKRVPSEKEQLWTLWIQRFLNGSDMSSIFRNIEELVTIAGSCYETNAVIKMISRINNGTGHESEDDQPWLKYDLTLPEKSPFYRRSPFGNICYLYGEEINQRNDHLRRKVNSGKAKFSVNEYESVAFLDYAKVHIIPYSPMLNKCVFNVFDLAIEDDTSNTVEYWIKIVKNDFLKEKLKNHQGLRIGQLVREHSKLVDGCLNRAMANLGKTFPENNDGGSESSSTDEVISDFDEDDEGFLPPENEQARYDPSESDSGNALELFEDARATSLESLTPEKQEEAWGAKTRVGGKRILEPENVIHSMPLIPWGANFCAENQTVNVVNSCSVDCCMQILYYLFTYTEKGKNYINSKKDGLSFVLKTIFRSINTSDFDQARLAWLYQILNLSMDQTICLFDDERENGTGVLREWMRCLNQKLICTNPNCINTAGDTSNISSLDLFPLNPEMMSEFFNVGYESECSICHSESPIQLNFDNPPEIFIFICNGQWKGEIKAKENDLTENYNFDGNLYRLTAYTMYTGTHFYAVFCHGQNRYTYNDKSKPLKLSKRKRLSNSDSVNSVWLQRI